MDRITHQELHQLAGAACNLGTLPSFAYVLCTHVLHKMHVGGTRQIMLRVQDMYGVVLRDAQNRVLAGQLETLIHEGIGTQIADPKVHISAHYIDALQKLHWAGLVFSDILESRLDEPGASEVHFTMFPELREGIHWKETTPVIYRLPDKTLEETVGPFARFLDSSVNPRYEKASFL